MADKIKDAEDRLLESIFRSEPIDDDGFSDRVMRRLRKRLWVRRLALPVAMVVGGAIAVKPASQAVVAVTKLLTVVPDSVLEAPAGLLPNMQGITIGGSLLQTVVFSAVLLAVGFFGSRMISE